MVTGESKNDGDALLQEQIVAYLDQELDEETQAHIERLMATDVNVREQVQQLQRVWDLLDELPRAEADDRFTTSTVELIAADIEKELQRQQDQLPQRQRRRWLAMGAALALTGWLSFTAVDWLWPHPDEQLLQNLDVIRNLDSYRQAGSVEFLQSLKDDRLFLEPEATHEP